MAEFFFSHFIDCCFKKFATTDEELNDLLKVIISSCVSNNVILLFEV